jgi:hypothetical protein
MVLVGMMSVSAFLFVPPLWMIGADDVPPSSLPPLEGSSCPSFFLAAVNQILHYEYEAR